MALVSEPVWSRIGEPFDASDLEWTVVEVADGGEEVRVTPRLSVEALHARFDAVLGVTGWSVSYAPLAGEAVACHVVIGGVTKGAVAPLALAGGGAATAAAAFTLAAMRFGVRLPWPSDADAWVACDPATFEPLHPPELPPGASVDRAAASPNGSPAGAAAATPESGSPAGEAAGEAAAPPAPKAEGQLIIDRLIERLKAEGQGLAAARILVKHGGYGKDPKAARELYGELRALLRASAGERDGDGSSGQP
jgi:hypothetical protein